MGWEGVKLMVVTEIFIKVERLFNWSYEDFVLTVRFYYSDSFKVTGI